VEFPDSRNSMALIRDRSIPAMPALSDADISKSDAELVALPFIEDSVP